MELTLLILSVFGSIASIVGFIIQFKNLQNRLLTKWLLFLVFAMSASTAVLAYQNKLANDPVLKERLKKEIAKNEAKRILSSFPKTIFSFEKGENKGVVYSSILFFESNKEIYPDTYKTVKNTMLKDLQMAEEEYISSDKKSKIEEAAKSMKQLLMVIANE